MASIVDRTPRNINDTANEGAGTAQVTASVVVVANADRIALWVSNLSNKAITVRFRAASEDNLFTGIIIHRDSAMKLIGSLDVYTGEVSIVGDGVDLAYSYIEY